VKKHSLLHWLVPVGVLVAMGLGAGSSAGSVRGRRVTLDPAADTKWVGTMALAINDRGQIVGYGTQDGGDRWHTFVWGNGKITDLGTLGGLGSRPGAPSGLGYRASGAINELGQVVGSSDTKAGAPWAHHAFVGRTARRPTSARSAAV
jgi:probable HAF family extracellular repeat protein